MKDTFVNIMNYLLITPKVFKPHLPNLETLLSANEKALAEDHLSLAKEDDQLLERFLYR